MPPPIVSDTFEALENLGGQMQQQTKQAAKTIVQEGKKSLGLGSVETPQNPNPPNGGPQEAQKEQIQKMEAAAKQKAAVRYKEIQQQILVIAKKKQQELPKEVTGKAGFSEDKLVKQLEEQKKPEAERKREQMEKEPIPLQREKKKTEMFRGAAG